MRSDGVGERACAVGGDRADERARRTGQVDGLGVGCRGGVGGRPHPADLAVVDVQHGIGDDGAGPVTDDGGGTPFTVPRHTLINPTGITGLYSRVYLFPIFYILHTHTHTHT